MKIADSRIGIHVYNTDNGSFYSVICYLNKSGKWIDVTLTSVSYFFNLNYQYRVSSWGIGDCLRYFLFTSNVYSGRTIRYVYGFFTSETYEGKITCISQKDEQKLNLDNISSDESIPNYFYNSELDSYEMLSYNYISANDSVLKSGVNYTLLPLYYSSYSATKGFLNNTFGEGHKIYQLYNGSTKVTTQVGEMVTINGKQVMSVGPVIYAE